MSAYYNEHDKHAVAWLRELIKAGAIADGDVDDRSILDVCPDDLAGYTQCHFFAGIGGWSLALRLAGWADERVAWTGSCPCQPFSVASVGYGGAEGQTDERHLWPTFYRLISECGPRVVFGEQVPSAIGWGWWDNAALDLEGSLYACAAVVLRARDVGADHDRRRLYWMADTGSTRRQGHQPVECVPVATPAPQPLDGDTFTRARRALDGDHGDLLPCDGLSVVMERRALTGYGNAIVPQVAAEVIRAYMEVA